MSTEWRKGTFSIDPELGWLDGYTDGTTWKGFARPVFAKKTVKHLFETFFSKEPITWEYDAATDMFMLESQQVTTVDKQYDITATEVEGVFTSQAKAQHYIEDIIPLADWHHIPMDVYSRNEHEVLSARKDNITYEIYLEPIDPDPAD